MRWIYASILCSAFAGALAAQPTLEEVFAAIDRFDQVEKTALPFVRVATGRWKQIGDEPAANSYRYGFLVGGRGREFRVRFLDLDETTYVRTVVGVAEHERVGFEPADLQEVVRDLIARLGEADPASHYTELGGLFSLEAMALLAARACERRGLTEEVEALWDAVLAERATVWLASGFGNRLVQDFADPGFRRVDLLQRHKAWFEAFPGMEADHIHARIETLEKMIAEDQTGSPHPPGSPNDLVWRLRDQFEPPVVWADDGQYFPERAADELAPTSQLRTLGFAAVPALIAALNDQRPSRCVWYSSRHGGGLMNVTVAWFAHDVLHQVTGVRLYGKQLQKYWERWWNCAGAQLAAVAAGLERGERTELEALIRRWELRDLLVRTDRPKLPQAHVTGVEKRGVEAITRFLIRSGDLAAVQAVGNDLQERGEAARHAVIKALGGDVQLDDVLAPCASDATQRVEIEFAIEGILVALVDDRNREIAEPARIAIAKHWQGRYEYDSMAVDEERRAQVAKIQATFERRCRARK